MRRLFEASPGFNCKSSSISKRKTQSNYHGGDNLVISETNMTSHNNIHRQIDSAKLLKFDSKKYSREESQQLPRFKTLEEMSDSREDNIKNVIRLNPEMKRSKTPSMFYKPSHIDYSRRKFKMEPKNYYGNISGTSKSAMKEEIEPKIAQMNNSASNVQEAHIEDMNHHQLRENYSRLIRSRINKVSSVGNIKGLHSQQPREKNDK